MVDGCRSAVPPDFSFPSVMVDSGWVLWMLGDAARSIRPFRLLDGARDLKGRRSRQKTFSTWKKLFLSIERFLRSEDSFKEDPTLEEARAMFECARPFVMAICHQRYRKRPCTTASELPLAVTTVSKAMKSHMTPADIMAAALI